VATSRLVGRASIVALFASALLAFTAPTSHADEPDDPLTALMMGGSGMPTPSQFWQDGIISAYINPATGDSYTPVLVPTPESFSSTSVSEGLAALQQEMAEQPAGEPYLIEGYSQSAVIAVQEKLLLMESSQPPPDVTFLLLGSLNRPDGGLFARFDGLVVPGLPDFVFNGAEPIDAGIPTIDISTQYDFFSDFPQYPINPIADLNALFGFFYAHAAYGNGPLPYEVPAIWPPSDPLSGPFVDEYVLGSTDIVRQVDGDTTFYFIPSTILPLLGPLHTLGVPEPVLNIFQPALQVLIEAGYDRSIPFSEAVPAELFPTLDPVTLTLQFANGVVQGADNAYALFGAQLPGFDESQSWFASAEAWSQQTIGDPYYQFVSDLNADFNPFTDFVEFEAPLGTAIQELLDTTGIQAGLIDPILGLFGPLAGLFTS
jgi:PE-PPE domain